MPHITRELLRRRAEHNEGMITTLEELTLHQEELEAINDVSPGLIQL
jgi:protein TilB